MAKKVTSIDVSKAAGVSQATVSRALNNSSLVSPELKDLVVKVARDIGYHRNAMARALVRGQSSNVAVISGDLENPFYALALHKITHRLSAANTGVLHYVAGLKRTIDDTIAQILEQQVDGIIVTAITLDTNQIAAILSSHIPTVFFNRTVADDRVSCVSSDSHFGGRLAADTLATDIHEKLCFVGGYMSASTDVERHDGFIERLRELGRDAPRLELGQFTYKGGYQAALSLMSDGNADAIFCASDLMALGVMDALRCELGLSVPRDVSVLGYGGLAIGGWASYKLTTIRSNLETLVDETITLLLSIMSNAEATTQIVVPCELLFRNSVRRDS